VFPYIPEGRNYLLFHISSDRKNSQKFSYFSVRLLKKGTGNREQGTGAVSYGRFDSYGRQGGERRLYKSEDTSDFVASETSPQRPPQDRPLKKVGDFDPGVNPWERTGNKPNH
jgi:hypothetical protein